MILLQATSHTARSGRALFLPSWFSYLPLYCFYAALLISHSAPAAARAPLELHSDTQTATAGYFQLRWDWPDASGDTHYELREHTTGSVRTVYSGTDLASVISGKPDGAYEYSVRAFDAQDQVLAQSTPLRVNVAHHSLQRAVLFFVMGLIVFVAILLVILRGAARHTQE